MKESPKGKRNKSAIKASSLVSTNPEPTKERKDIDQLTTKWIPYFKDTNNLYPNDLALRYRRSATTASLINAAVNYTVGSGFIYKVNEEPIEKEDLKEIEWINDVNTDVQSLEELYRDMVFNYKAFGNIYIEVSKARVKGSKDFVYNLKVHDSTKCRINKSRTKCYISSFWREIKLDAHGGQYPDPTEVDLWDRKKNTNQSRFIIHIKRKVPEYDYYGLPDYVATLKDADIEYNIDTYNLERLENGFFPSAIVSLFGDPPEGYTAKGYVQALDNKYSSSQKAGKTLWQLLDDPEQKADIQEFSGANKGEFLELEESAKRGMMQGHRMHPLLADIETAGKLGSSSEVVNHWRKYMETVCIPEHQNPTLKVLNMILEMIGYDFRVSVLNKPPVGLEDQIDVKSVLTQDEQREIIGFDPADKEIDNGSDNRDTDSSGDKD